MDTLDSLSDDEAHLVRMYREADRLVKCSAAQNSLPSCHLPTFGATVSESKPAG
jgi:hypothetical protein